MRAVAYFLLGFVLAAAGLTRAYAEDYAAVEKYGFAWNNAPYTSAAAHGAFVCSTYGNATIGTSFAGHYGDSVWPPTSWAPGVQHVACTGGTQQGPLAVGYDTNQFLECPGGGTLSGTTCTAATACTPPETRVAGVCTAPSCPAAGTAGAPTGTTVGGAGSTFPATVCIGGCAYNTGSGMVAGSQWAGSVSNATGGSCSNDAPSSAACPAGQGEMTINGVTTCVAASAIPGATTVDNNTTTTGTTNAGGVTTGTSVTTNTTTCAGTVCTTTTNTTTYDGSGNVTGGSSSTSEKARDPFCKENPQSIICRATSFSGACGAFVCDGDGVQCAIAREQHQRNCDLFGTTSAESTRAAQFAAGNDPDSALFPHPALPGNRTSQSLPSSLDQSTFLGGGGLLDVTTSFQGQSFTVPLSQLTGTLQMLGNLLVAFALLAGAMIVFRG